MINKLKLNIKANIIKNNIKYRNNKKIELKKNKNKKIRKINQSKFENFNFNYNHNSIKRIKNKKLKKK